MKSPRKSRRSKSKSLVKIPLTTQGGLFGYHVNTPAKGRRSLLKRILSKRKATYSEIVKRLNVLVIYNKRRHPEISAKVKTDIDYIHRHLTKYKKSPTKKSKRRSVKRRSVKRKSKSKSKSKRRSKRRSVKRRSVKRRSVKRGSVKRGSVKGKSVKRRSVKRKSVKRRSVKRKSKVRSW
jgi:hypothetical protein